MKLLIITQKVDKDDSVLGFFHLWIERLAQKVEKINVICLWEGKHNLPNNVTVWSLGKEKFIHNSRHSYIIRRFVFLWRFYKYTWKLGKDYDIVFVHMNPIYVVLGGIFWKVWRKKIFLWYNHKYGNFKTGLGIKIADKVYYTSPFAFSAKFKKSKKMPAGIDTELFKRDESIQKLSNSILYLGRISPIKNVDILIEAVELLDKQDIDFILNIVGEPGEKDKKYFREIKELGRKLEERGKIRFLGKVPNYKTPEIYNQNGVLVNLTPFGSFDKVILEAMACETLVLVSNKSFAGVLPDFLIFEEKNSEDLVQKIKNIFQMEEKKREKLRKTLRKLILEYHSLDNLINNLINEFKK